jgi:hypothetical protein
VADRPLYPVSRHHLDALGGPFGIWQHAAGIIPSEAFGYCTDDVARALQVDLLHRRELGWEAVRTTAWRSLRFLHGAFDPSTGCFRNFRAADGSWLEAVGSEDSQGRALLALGVALAEAPEDAAVAHARTLFVGALPATRRVAALRATASALLGCSAALDGGLRGETQQAFEELASRLRRAFTAVELDRDWPWPEASLTYENALLPRALLVAGARLGDDDLRRTGLQVLDWLIRVQTTPDGAFSPIGSDAWWPRGAARSRFDQQPIEATAMILAAETAFHETGEERYRRVVEVAYGWFLGDNELGVPLADPVRGGCHDGLTPRGVNLNQGAESTLMWLTALEHVRGMRVAAASVIAGRALGPVPLLAGARS